MENKFKMVADDIYNDYTKYPSVKTAAIRFAHLFAIMFAEFLEEYKNGR